MNMDKSKGEREPTWTGTHKTNFAGLSLIHSGGMLVALREEQAPFAVG